MGKQRDLNIEEKTKALAWRIYGVSTKVIGQRLGWSQHSIQRLFLMGKTYRRLIAGRGLYIEFFFYRNYIWENKPCRSLFLVFVHLHRPVMRKEHRKNLQTVLTYPVLA
jgi:hypothetical protein